MQWMANPVPSHGDCEATAQVPAFYRVLVSLESLLDRLLLLWCQPHMTH